MSVVKNFSGKVVLITGSSAGIGAKTAEEFSKAGAQVAITGRNAGNLSEVGKLCFKASANGLKALEVVADVSKEKDCKRLIDSTIKKFGKLDILVNNAGRAAISSVEDPQILQTFDELMNLNLRSVVLLTHLSVKHLEKTKGNIINISSCAALKPGAFAVYSMTKSALDMFTRCTALELGPKGIRVNVVNPSLVKTNAGPAMGLDKDQYEATLDQIGKSTYPLGRVGEPKDVANTILFLASDDCSWVTGINFVTDGGSLNAPQ